MRRLPSSLGLAAIVVLSSFFAADRATAQTFPNAPASASPFWIPIRRASLAVVDATNANADARDVVGDAAHPAAFVASDASYLYLRVRVNGDPGTGTNRAFGCLIDTDGTLGTYEFLATYDANGTDTIRYFANTTAGTTNTTNNPAETSLATFPATSNGKITVADTTFSSNADYFVDLAVPWTTIRTGGVTSTTSLRFICGTSTTTTAAKGDVNSDIFDGATNQTLMNNWSEPYTCNDGGNPRCTTASDPDGDGVITTVETALGTSSTNFDSDGDGIPDYFELRAGTDVTFSAVDTDSDGTIDALDTDSDNDCVADGSDGLASDRNSALPNAQASLACSGAKPICNPSTGACAACDGDMGGGTMLACYDPAHRYCDASGRCQECTASKTFLCTSAKPACETTTGACAACNGDHASGSTAACPAALTPACHPGGSALAGTCTQCSQTNTSLCPPQSPACSTTVGTCAQCTGDNGAATTAPCSTTALPACNAAGPFKGRCTVCSASNVSKCPIDKPTCDPNGGVCAPCDGDRNGGTLLGCPSAAAPTCALSGANKGQCAKCASSADCGLGHTGPTCDTATGACVDIDTDADGIQDEVEDLLGTDKTKKDSDDDGIDDKTEVTPQGGGSFAKVDTDGDGTIDARDDDSDGDGLLDKDEWTAGDGGAVLDTDGDLIPNFRDDDDDGDAITTAEERTDTANAKVSDDVDDDGLPNWLDSDANGNGKLDGIDTRADDDNDGIPNYLDPKKDDPIADAGPSSSSSSSSSSSGSTSGFTKTPSTIEDHDAAAPGVTPDDAVLEGSGCSTTSGSLSSVMAFMLGVLGVGVASRRRKR